ncbi:hypothetical protein M8J76_006457 [Diaphorina citri]|nr:hypothetical protein M8J76_006457 [Diaphorina citri]
MLISGGSGFLGQHIVRELHTENNVVQIRVLDLVPFHNDLGYEEKVPVLYFQADITKPDTLQDEIFNNVTVVFHCATFISYAIPSDTERLERVNVQGTQTLLAKCIQFKIGRFIYNGSTEACVTAYRGLHFSMVINPTEIKCPAVGVNGGKAAVRVNGVKAAVGVNGVKAAVGVDGVKAAVGVDGSKVLVAGGYGESLARAEHAVLTANGTRLSSGVSLRTIALRHTPLYGETDKGFIPALLQLSHQCNRKLPRICGSGNKYQFTYVGNAAWANIQANNTLKLSTNQIAGFPVFITDDTPIMDTLHFVCKLINSGDATETHELKRENAKLGRENREQFRIDNQEPPELDREDAKQDRAHPEQFRIENQETPKLNRVGTKKKHEMLPYDNDYQGKLELDRENAKQVRANSQQFRIETQETPELDREDAKHVPEKPDHFRSDIQGQTNSTKRTLRQSYEDYYIETNLTLPNIGVDLDEKQNGGQDGGAFDTNNNNEMEACLKSEMKENEVDIEEIKPKERRNYAGGAIGKITPKETRYFKTENDGLLNKVRMIKTNEDYDDNIINKLRFSPCALINAMNSIVMFDGLRSKLYLPYEPKYSFASSVCRSGQYYRTIPVKRFQWSDYLIFDREKIAP